MPKIIDLHAENEDLLCAVGKALSSKTRIQILKLLFYNSYNIGEIAELCQIPASSAAFHVKILADAQLINTESQPGNRGHMKLCSRKHDSLNIHLLGLPQNIDQVTTVSMPVGMFTNCKAVPTCGLASPTEIIGAEDNPNNFYLPKRAEAEILWSSGGFVEYVFPYSLPGNAAVKQLTLSFEACSEAPNYREDWQSDITIWLKNIECATWRSPGDFGERRGLLNPSWWDNGLTQYGQLVKLEITKEGTFLNSEYSSDVKVKDLRLQETGKIAVRIGNKETAEYAGGFNLFGSNFGDYHQDIVLSVIYTNNSSD